MDGEVLLAGLERHPFGTAQLASAVALQPEVVMQSPRIVALDDEDRRAGPFRERRGNGSRRRLRVAFSPVVLELRHGA